MWHGLPWKGGPIQLQGGSSEGFAWPGRCSPHVAHPHDWQWYCSWQEAPVSPYQAPLISLFKGPPDMMPSFPRIWDQGRSHNAFSTTLSQKPHTLTFILSCWLQSLPRFNVGGGQSKSMNIMRSDPLRAIWDAGCHRWPSMDSSHSKILWLEGIWKLLIILKCIPLKILNFRDA